MNVRIENDSLCKLPFMDIPRGDYFLYGRNNQQRQIPFKRITDDSAVALGTYRGPNSGDYICKVGQIESFYPNTKMIMVDKVDIYPFGRSLMNIDRCMQACLAEDVDSGGVILFNNVIYMKAWDNTFIPIYDLKNQSNNCSLSHLSKVMPSDDVIILNDFQLELHINGRF